MWEQLKAILTLAAPRVRGRAAGAPRQGSREGTHTWHASEWGTRTGLRSVHAFSMAWKSIKWEGKRPFSSKFTEGMGQFGLHQNAFRLRIKDHNYGITIVSPPKTSCFWGNLPVPVETPFSVKAPAVLKLHCSICLKDLLFKIHKTAQGSHYSSVLTTTQWSRWVFTGACDIILKLTVVQIKW